MVPTRAALLKMPTVPGPQQLSVPTAHMEVANYLEVTGERKEWDKPCCIQDCLHGYFSKNVFIRTCIFMLGSFLPFLSSDNVV